MKITRQDSPQREALLTIELESSDFEPFLDRAYRRLVQRLNIPGFRRGKAPRNVVEAYVGRDALINEALSFSVPEVVDQVVQKEGLEAYGLPRAELVEVEPLTVKATVPLKPEVDLDDYRSIRLPWEPVEVKDEQVEEMLKSFQRQAAPWEPVDRPVKFEDLVTLDVDAWVDNQRVGNDRNVDYIPTMDNPRPVPGFAVNLEGLSKGQTKEFTVKLPEDYSQPALAGKEVRFKVTVHEIKEKKLPELNDDFARSLGEGYESLEALKQKVRETLKAQMEEDRDSELKKKALDEVVKRAKVVSSPIFVEREIDHLIEDRVRALQQQRVSLEDYLDQLGKSEQELRNELRPQAEERVIRALVIRRLAELEGLEAGDEDVDAQVNAVAASLGVQPERLRDSLSEEGWTRMANNALVNKVLQRLLEIVKSPAPEPAGPAAEVGQSEGGASHES